MPGPIRRTPSYKASDFLKPEYRRSPTPELDPDQPSTSSSTHGARTSRTSTRRRRNNDWSFSPDKDADWAMSSAPSLDDKPGRPTLISTRSSTRNRTLESTSPSTSPKMEEDSASTGRIDFSLGESSSQSTQSHPHVPMTHALAPLGLFALFPGRLGTTQWTPPPSLNASNINACRGIWPEDSPPPCLVPLT